MAEFVFQMIKARKSYGDRVILDDVTLSFLPGAKIGVVGPNGMGKSTLLKLLLGELQPQADALERQYIAPLLAADPATLADADAEFVKRYREGRRPGKQG